MGERVWFSAIRISDLHNLHFLTSTEKIISFFFLIFLDFLEVFKKVDLNFSLSTQKCFEFFLSIIFFKIHSYKPVASTNKPPKTQPKKIIRHCQQTWQENSVLFCNTKTRWDNNVKSKQNEITTEITHFCHYIQLLISHFIASKASFYTRYDTHKKQE